MTSSTPTWTRRAAYWPHILLSQRQVRLSQQVTPTVGCLEQGQLGTRVRALPDGEPLEQKTHPSELVFTGENGGSVSCSISPASVRGDSGAAAPMP